VGIMKKSGLEDGDKIIYRNGWERIIKGDSLLNSTMTEKLSLTNVGESLKEFASRDSSIDVMKVYRPKDIQRFEYELIYERREVPNLIVPERNILENVNPSYKWIARNEDGELRLYKDEPFRHGEHDEWVSMGGSYALGLFNHLYQFVTWEGIAWRIEELLEG